MIRLYKSWQPPRRASIRPKKCNVAGVYLNITNDAAAGLAIRHLRVRRLTLNDPQHFNIGYL